MYASTWRCLLRLMQYEVASLLTHCLSRASTTTRSSSMFDWTAKCRTRMKLRPHSILDQTPIITRSSSSGRTQQYKRTACLSKANTIPVPYIQKTKNNADSCIAIMLYLEIKMIRVRLWSHTASKLISLITPSSLSSTTHNSNTNVRPIRRGATRQITRSVFG